jgi:glycosyltransferase involved in cell wall biosynthesis
VEVSVVIPTCNRRERLLSLLDHLDQSIHPILEIVIVDSSDERRATPSFTSATKIPIRYVESERKSVCFQRNVGVRSARGGWIFLCDDDVEVPPDYLTKVAAHIVAHPEAGAASGLFLERTTSDWTSTFPVKSSRELLWRYVFQQGVWGEIQSCGRLAGRIKHRYARRGNGLSRAGFPVLVDFSGDYFRTRVYSLGASLVRKDWLIASPFDENLDSHGIGDNFGVAIGFPGAEMIHVVTDAFVRHHKEAANRLAPAEAYARRLMALHYFIRTREELAGLGVREAFFLWSLFGQFVFHAGNRNARFAWAAASTLLTVARGRNPLLEGRARKR